MTTLSLFFLFLLSISVYSSLVLDLTEPGCRRFSYSNRPSQDCSGIGMKALPPLFHDTIALNLGNNSLFEINEFPSTYSTLLSLRLDFCEIRKINVKALAELRSLKTLDLAHNQLQHIVFSPRNRALTTINLSYNNLKYLPDFSALTSLRLLDVSHNRLISIQPRFLPLNVESLRFTGNQLSHLNQWPFLTRLQELDVSFNPLVCECPLWRFVSWAEGLALFDSYTLPCIKPASLRRNENGQLLCGPEIDSSGEMERSVVGISEDTQLCCTVSSSPLPFVFWQHHGHNVSKGSSVKQISDSGRMKYCLDVNIDSIERLGLYRCIISLSGIERSKEFYLERDKVPLVLHSPDSILFYGEFVICVFLVVLTCVSCCCIRREHVKKKRRCKMEYFYPDAYYPAQCSQPVRAFQEDFVGSESPKCSEYQKHQLEIWRQRMALLPAPLAEFDQDSYTMPLVHTAV